MEFEKCPRCGGEWERHQQFADVYRCKQCAMFMEGKLLNYYFTMTQHLDWNLDHMESCFYHDENIDPVGLTLPWLPFDITEEAEEIRLTQPPNAGT